MFISIFQELKEGKKEERIINLNEIKSIDLVDNLQEGCKEIIFTYVSNKNNDPINYESYFYENGVCKADERFEELKRFLKVEKSSVIKY